MIWSIVEVTFTTLVMNLLEVSEEHPLFLLQPWNMIDEYFKLTQIMKWYCFQKLETEYLILLTCDSQDNMTEMENPWILAVGVSLFFIFTKKLSYCPENSGQFCCRLQTAHCNDINLGIKFGLVWPGIAWNEWWMICNLQYCCTLNTLPH